MSRSEINDPIQLQQTIIYLRAELHKYKNKYNQSSSSLVDELQAENDRLTNKYKELLHQNKKNEKRIRLYEQRIQSLEAQCKDSVTHSEVMKTVESLEWKVDRILDLAIPSQQKLSNLLWDLKASRQLNETQFELITILEAYIQQLIDEPSSS